MKFIMCNKELAFSNGHWSDKQGNQYPCTQANNFCPVNESNCMEPLDGYFIVEVTDPNGIIGKFCLYAEKAYVFMGVCSHPGLSTKDNEVEGAKLMEAGLLRPEMDYSFLPEVICYGINEGPDRVLNSGSINLMPWFDDKDDSASIPESELTYTWKIL